MKDCKFNHNTGLLILRLILAAVFIYHVIPKLGAPDGMVAFIGWAPIWMWLDFLSASTWFYLAVVWELFIVLSALLGFWTRCGSVVLWIIMFFAMTAKKWGMPAIEMDLILAGIGLVLFIAGPGKYAVEKSNGMGCKNDK